MVKSEVSVNVGTTYQRMADEFFSIEIPIGWEARYMTMNGVDQHNMITFRSPEDVQQNSTSPNSLSIQRLDRDGPVKFDVQEYANREASANPGGNTKARKSNFNGMDGVLAVTTDLPFKIDQGQILCNVWTRYVQNPKNMKLFRVSFWYDKTKEKEFNITFDHMLKSFRFK